MMGFFRPRTTNGDELALAKQVVQTIATGLEMGMHAMTSSLTTFSASAS